MPDRDKTRRPAASARGEAGPRAILRVTEVLLAVGTAASGRSLAELADELAVPKTSLHRMVRTLEQGGFLNHNGGIYTVGPESFRLGRVLTGAAPSVAFPACARPALEWLWETSGESAMLSDMTEDGNGIVYVEVLKSEAPLRYAPSLGQVRPLYAVPAGKVVLAFLPADEQARYIANTRFRSFTEQTTSRRQIEAALATVREQLVAYELNGFILGGSGIAAPIFSSDGAVRNSVSLAGPTDRIVANADRLIELVRESGRRISRAMGYDGPYGSKP